MNIENVNKAIAVMERVKARGDKVDMRNWQTGGRVLTEDAAHECGTAACFAGWVALSPEFQADGGMVGMSGLPIMATRAVEYISFQPNGQLAIAVWLDIDPHEARGLCALDGSQALSDYYAKPVKDVTVDDVLEKLYKLRESAQ